LLTAARTEIEFTASTINAHIDRLARTAERIPIESNIWLHISTMAIKGLILAARSRNMEVPRTRIDAEAIFPRARRSRSTCRQVRARRAAALMAG